ncbi:phosphopantothenate/pantothenate synthetase [Candidatus Latescibacterota bacterium]
MTDVPESHPRYVSLRLRDAIVAGVEAGVTSVHGRGEAFDYLIGEATRPFAAEAIRAAAAMLITARHPVLSVNGNAAALVPDELVALGRELGAPLEVNIFHASGERERAIASHLRAHGADTVLLPTREAQLDYIDSNRRFVNPEGILRADVIFVPLEDGDRCQALRKMGKQVITVDLNPLSRTSRTASITVVDNVARAMPRLIEELGPLCGLSRSELDAIIDPFENERVLAAAADCVRRGG